MGPEAATHASNWRPSLTNAHLGILGAIAEQPAWRAASPAAREWLPDFSDRVRAYRTDARLRFTAGDVRRLDRIGVALIAAGERDLPRVDAHLRLSLGQSVLELRDQLGMILRRVTELAPYQ